LILPNIDLDQLERLARLRATVADCAAFFKVDKKAINEFCKSTVGVTYDEFKEQSLVHTRMSLSRKAIEMALAGDKTMLTFCLKNINGWSDSPAGGEIQEIPRAVFSIVPRVVSAPESKAE
jgi:hypothetical protein